MTDREAFEAWHGGRYRGLQADIAWAAWQAALAAQQKPEAESQKVTDDDGCPLEMAVLKRFWRAQQKAEPVLLNLALRLRMARRCLKQALSSNANQRYIDQLRGAETEAWNSFQAAKAIVAPPTAQQKAEPVADAACEYKDACPHCLMQECTCL